MSTSVYRTILHSPVLCPDLLELVINYLGRGLTQVENIEPWTSAIFVPGLGRVCQTGPEIFVLKGLGKLIRYNCHDPYNLHYLGYSSNRLVFYKVAHNSTFVIAMDLASGKWDERQLRTQGKVLVAMDNDTIILLCKNKKGINDVPFKHQVMTHPELHHNARKLGVMGSYLVYYTCFYDHSKCPITGVAKRGLVRYLIVLDRKSGFLKHKLPVSSDSYLFDPVNDLLYTWLEPHIVIYDSVTLALVRKIKTDEQFLDFAFDDNGHLMVMQR